MATRKTPAVDPSAAVPGGTVVVIEPYTQEWRRSVREQLNAAKADEAAAVDALDAARAELVDLEEVRRLDLDPREYVTERDVIRERITRAELVLRAATARVKAAERADHDAGGLTDDTIARFVGERLAATFDKIAKGLPLGRITVRPAGPVTRVDGPSRIDYRTPGQVSGAVTMTYEGEYPVIVRAVLGQVSGLTVDAVSGDTYKVSASYIDPELAEQFNRAKAAAESRARAAAMGAR